MAPAPSSMGSRVRAEVREEAERDVAQRSRRLRASYGSMSAARVGKEISLAVLNPETGRLESDPLGGESEERGEGVRREESKEGRGIRSCIVSWR